MLAASSRRTLRSSVIPDTIRKIRQGGRVPREHLDDGQPRWIHLPIAEALLLSSRVEMPTCCETLRHQGKRRTATTFHAVLNIPGEPDHVWVACAECTSLMLDDVGATVA
jgi:hypothetical protein